MLTSAATVSGLVVDQSLIVGVVPLVDSPTLSSVEFCYSPLSDVLRTEELDILNELLDLHEPAAPNELTEQRAAVLSPSIKRERCADCCSHAALERSSKRLRASSPGDKRGKSKSQSQRQKEEISLLKQQVDELSATLEEMQERKRQYELASDSSDNGNLECTVNRGAVSGAKRTWQGVAEQQETERRSVERDNAALRDEVANCWMKMKTLERSIITAQVDQLRQTNQHGLADELSAVISSA